MSCPSCPAPGLPWAPWRVGAGCSAILGLLVGAVGAVEQGLLVCTGGDGSASLGGWQGHASSARQLPTMLPTPGSLPALQGSGT